MTGSRGKIAALDGVLQVRAVGDRVCRPFDPATFYWVLTLGRRLRGAGGGVALSQIEDLDEGRRRLRTRHRILAVDDEAGHAVDAEPPRIDVGGDDLLAAFVALQEAARRIAVEPGANRALDQDVRVADIETVLEVGLEERGHDLVLAFLRDAPEDQAVRQHGVGRAPDPGELEFDSGLAARLADRLVDLARPVAAAELGAHIVVARQP